MSVTKRSLSVSFNGIVKSVRYPFGDGDAAELYWQEDELFEIRKNIVDTVQKIEAGFEIELYDDEYCFRGVERLMEEQASKIAQRRRNAMDAVLDHQESCWNVEVVTPDDMNIERLAAIYSKATEESENEAYLVGLGDEFDAATLNSHGKIGKSSPRMTSPMLSNNRKRQQNRGRSRTRRLPSARAA